MVQLVFVYGTLRRGERNHSLLDAARQVGEGATVGRFTLLNLGAYPAVVNAVSRAGGSQICGEIYEVDAPTLTRLDRLEGCPNLFFRQEQQVRLPDGRTLVAWMYFLTSGDVQGADEIATGDWRDRIHK